MKINYILLLSITTVLNTDEIQRIVQRLTRNTSMVMHHCDEKRAKKIYVAGKDKVELIIAGGDSRDIQK